MNIAFDASQIIKIGNILAAAGERAPVAISRALNHTAQKARTKMAREVVAQTGLKYGTIRRALKLEHASPGNLSAAVYSRGGDISLKYFGAREGGGGVSARPRGVRIFKPKAFILSGRPGNRRAVEKLNGHVYQNASGGRWRGKIKKVKSGVIIPDEMIDGASADAFNATAQASLANRIAHELLRVL